MTQRRLRVALLLSTPSFEAFYGRVLGLDEQTYLTSYRGEWSWDYLRALQGQDIEPILYVADERRDGRRRTPDGYDVRFVPLAGPSRSLTRVRGVERTAVGRYALQAVNALGLRAALGSALAHDGVDVLLVQEYWTARFDLLAGHLGVPVVGIDQGTREEGELRVAKRRALARASRLVVQTTVEEEKVARFGGAAVRIPNAVDTAFLTPGDDQEVASPPTVLAVARLYDRQKRLVDLLRAVERLGSPWRVDLVGRGPDRALLQAEATKLRLGDRVSMPGFVLDRAAMRERYRTCTVFAIPSAYEGLPVALLEAMSCGAAVVGSEIAAIAEVVEHGRSGLLVPVGRPDLLAAAITDAAGRRAELGTAARRTAEAKFSHQRLGARLREVIAKAAGRAP